MTTKIKKSDLAKAYVKVIELELSYYQEQKVHYERIKENPLYSASFALFETERRLKAIELTLLQLSKGQEPKKLEFLKLKYFDKKLIDLAIQQALFIEQATFYRWRQEIIGLVAYRLGIELN